MPAPLSTLGEAIVAWWQHWLHLTLLNLVWALSWLLVVPGPPVTLAVYAYLARLVEGDEMSPAEFLGAVRTHFWRGWRWGVVVVLPPIALAAALVYYARFPGGWARAAELAATLLVFGWLVVGSYALPYLFVQERRALPLAYKNALLTLLASPLHAVVVGLFLAVVTAASLRFMALTFLVTPVVVAMVGTYAVRERLARFGLRAT